MGLFDQYKYAYGSALDKLGTLFNAPEKGWSERIAGGSTPGTGRSPTSIAAGYSIPSLGQAAPQTTFGQLNQNIPTLVGGPGGIYTPKTTTKAPTTAGGGGNNQSAQDILRAMDQGLINWDDNLRSMLQGQFGGPSDEELNQIYGGAYEALNAQERALEEGQPLTLQGIEQSATRQKTPLEEKRKTGLEEYATQEQQTRTAESSALSQARQLYNELTQYNLSRFGAGTSAGPAAAELLGRATTRQIGETTRTAGENINQISLAKQKLNEFTDRTISEIDQDTELKKQQADQWLKDRLNEIAASRAGLESDKAAKRYEALRARQDFINQLEMQRQGYMMELDTWRQQQEFSMAQKAGGYQLANVSPAGITSGAQQFQATAPRAEEPRYSFGTTSSGQQYFAPQSGIYQQNSLLKGRTPGVNYIEENGLVINPTTREVVGVAG